MKFLIIMRGIPGSGKSTYVNNHYPNATVCSADHYFIDRDGTHNFNPSLLGKAHRTCKYKCERALAHGEEIVVVDNTNTRPSEFKQYRKLAKEFGYATKVIRMDCNPELAASRNIHGVPPESVRKMAERMAPFPDEQVVTVE